MQKTNAKYIVIEGLDGAGKSTLVSQLALWLRNKKYNVITTYEPGGTIVGDELREILKNPKSMLDEISETLLLYAARRLNITQVVQASLKKNIWVLADRHELSTRAYQGGGRGIDQNILQQLHNFTLGNFTPDMVIYLDITPELCLSRIKKLNKSDRIEQESLELFTKVRNAYLENIKYFDVKIIDASNLENIYPTAISLIANKFNI